LELNASEKAMKDLVSEDPVIFAERNRLETRRKRLVDIKQKLDDFGHDSGLD
jgi:hypothetical protein